MAVPKYNWGFSPFNLTEETPKEVTRLQGISKAFFTIIIGATWFASSADNALYGAGAALLVDTLLGCLFVEKVTPEQGK
jgi:hypothetical protein